MKKTIALFIVVTMIISVMPIISHAEGYKLRNVNDGAYTEVSMSAYQTYQTEHFQIFYDTDGANSGKVTDEFLKKCETVLENCWDLYIDKMGMEPTSTSVNSDGDKTTQYKTNVILMGTGVTYYDLGADDWGAYGSVDSCGYPYFMCCLAAMDAPTVVAHEFGHAVHYAQGDNAWKDNIFLGPWFEAVANWFAEQYIYEYMPGTTQLSHLYLRETSLTKMNGRGYYEAWPILQYLTEDPDNTGVYGEKFVQKLLSTNMGTNALFWELLESANGSLSTADTVGLYASHIATMDFKKKDLYNRYINNFYNGHYFYWQQRYTMLEKLGEEENTYSVPIERAPQAMGYNITPLSFTPGEVTVKLNALTDVYGADWRARLIKESKGETSYSDLFSDGETMTITVAAQDELYLSVAATPSLDSMPRHTITGWADHSKESNFPYENKTQYPYSVTLTNAVPMTRPGYGGRLKQHSNGGGWVSYGANVAPTAYVGPNALVLDYATVSDNAVIDGYAIVAGNARVTDNAYVGDTAVLFDRAQVSGNARVIENACLYVDYKVSGNAVVKGQALGLYNGTATGETIIYGDWYEDEGLDITGGRFSGWHSVTTDENYAVRNGDLCKRSYITGLRTRYEFNSSLRDTYGHTDLYGVGSPKLDSDTVSFDGTNYIVLDDSVLYYDNMKIALKAKGQGEVLNIGDEIVLTLGDKAVLKVGGSEIAVDAGEDWNVIEIDFNEGTVVLSVNGSESGINAGITPLEATRSGENYIGRGFTGSVDYMRIFDLASYAESDSVNYDELRLVLNSEKDNAFDSWRSNSGNVAFDNGLHITGNTAATVTSDGYRANMFVIEFEPSGGKAYPDHGILDIDGDVLSAHRYAADAGMIYVGRGETNSAIRGSGYVTDTASQQRLTNFVAEYLGGASARSDRGAVNYSDGDVIRIVAENTVWDDELRGKFQSSENYTDNLSSMTKGEDVYTVSYYLIDDGLVLKISESVYKGHFNGFGGFKSSGGANGVTVSYNNLKIYTDNAEPKVLREDMAIKSYGFENDATAIFAAYDESFSVYTEKVRGDFEIVVPEGFEKSKFMLFSNLEEMTPLMKALDVVAGTVYTSSVGQNKDAFFGISKKDATASYTFELVDNGSVDSGIIIGSSNAGLNTSSSNYFSSGSIVILFADGKLYTRDNAAKTLRAEYAVKERVKVRIDADVKANTYDLYVNGELAAKNAAFRTNTNVLDTLALVENKGGAAFNVYNFRVM